MGWGVFWVGAVGLVGLIADTCAKMGFMQRPAVEIRKAITAAAASTVNRS